MHLNAKEENAQRVTQNKALAYSRTLQEAVEAKKDKSVNRQMWQSQLESEKSRAYQIKTDTLR